MSTLKNEMNAAVGMRDDLRRLLGREALPEEEAIWLTLSADQRDVAFARSGALEGYEAAGRRDARTWIERSGMSEPRFYALAAAWRKERSLAKLIPHAKRRAPRATLDRHDVVDAARSAVRERSDESREAIAAELFARFGSPSLSWMRRLVARERGSLEKEQAAGGGGFGRTLVVDGTALVLPLVTDDEEEVDWAAAAFVLDVATGSIVGHALGRVPVDRRLYAEAAAAAEASISRLRPSSAGMAAPVIRTTLPVDVVAAFREDERFRGLGNVETVWSSRSGGSELVKVLGGRLGDLDLRPRFASDTFNSRVPRLEALARARMVPMTLAEARLLLAHEVDRHNAGRMSDDPVLAAAPSRIIEALTRAFEPWR